MLLDEIISEREAIQSLPILATRWCVVESFEAFHDESGRLVPPETKKVSPFFHRKEDALLWKLAHDEEGVLVLRVQYLREFTEQRWSSI